MADLTVLSTGLEPLWPEKSNIKSVKAAVDVTAGQAGHINANGKGALADADGASPANRFRGIYLQTVKAGQPVDLLIDGWLQGYDLSALAYDAPVYVSNTAGALADAAGTTSLLAGRVFPLNDPDKTKVLRVTGWAG